MIKDLPKIRSIMRKREPGRSPRPRKICLLHHVGSQSQVGLRVFLSLSKICLLHVGSQSQGAPDVFFLYFLFSDLLAICGFVCAQHTCIKDGPPLSVGLLLSVFCTSG